VAAVSFLILVKFGPLLVTSYRKLIDKFTTVTTLLQTSEHCAPLSTSTSSELSPTETLVEFDFGCKFMFVTGKIEFYAAVIILLINANEGRRFGVRNASFGQGC
jgi:hypothetical protein